MTDNTTPAATAETLPYKNPDLPAGERIADLLSRSTAGGLDLVRIPADSHAELGRENSGARPEGVSMDAVISDNQRDAQTRLLIDGLGGTR